MNQTRHHVRLVLLGTLLGFGCGRGAPSAPAAQSFRPVADVKQLMASVVEPAANVYWNAVGSVVDKNGVTDIAPHTDAEWAAVRDSAYVVAEAGNLLMMDGRARDTGNWMTLSKALVDVGQRAVRAAESKNTTAVFDVGAEVYDACVACHVKYMPGVMRPVAERRKPGS
jgi:hypothetical protein